MNILIMKKLKIKRRGNEKNKIKNQNPYLLILRNYEMIKKQSQKV